jgi:3'-phosphoadenosine 5'-phosphosulfate sulfotransferase (PAPS reductase)/FAD synthetase
MNRYYYIDEENKEVFNEESYYEINKDYPVIAWWSGGVTSAITCKLCIDIYGKDNVRIIFIDTDNEDIDTYRFKNDCEKFYNKNIEVITGLGGEYKSIKDVWYKYKSLNVANGAVCSGTLKRDVRKKWQKDNKYKAQAFGFEMDEIKRAKGMTLNYPEVKPIFPLLMYGLTKKDCIEMLQDYGLEVPRMYKLGFHNNNCFGKSDTSYGGCVQGGIGYWQKLKKDYPQKFEEMAKIEHELTDLKGKPVTMLKDQSKTALETGRKNLFLKPHKDYPQHKDISMIKGREVKPIFECNGFCGINDLEKRSSTEAEINYGDQTELF